MNRLSDLIAPTLSSITPAIESGIFTLTLHCFKLHLIFLCPHIETYVLAFYKVAEQNEIL